MSDDNERRTTETAPRCKHGHRGLCGFCHAEKQPKCDHGHHGYCGFCRTVRR
jgi:hypothetical protein